MYRNLDQIFTEFSINELLTKRNAQYEIEKVNETTHNLLRTYRRRERTRKVSTLKWITRQSIR